MIVIDDKAKCTGCGACVNICLQNAISLIPDKHGDTYPNVNNDKCTQCSLCEKVCPLLNEIENSNYIEPLVKVAWNTDVQIRENSTSGGVYSALAESFIKQGGYIVGAEYDSDFSIVHRVTSNIEDISKLRQSKYAQSELGDVFKKIKTLLQDHQSVMFCGSPCQVAGLKRFLRKDYDNLFTIDFICRGIISQKVYKKYLLSVKKHTGSEIKKVHFKNKDFGWNRFSTKIDLDNDSVYHKDRYSDEYMVGYLKHNLYMRPCCYECKFKTLPRFGDITLGDFWGIGNYDKNLDNDMGTSVVMVNSDKGEKLLELCKNSLFTQDSDLDTVTKGNSCLFNSPSVGKYRDYFYSKYEHKDFIDLIHSIDSKSMFDRENLTFRDKLYLMKNKAFKK